MKSEFLDALKRLVLADKRLDDASSKVAQEVLKNFSAIQKNVSEQQEKAQNDIERGTKITSHKISL